MVLVALDNRKDTVADTAKMLGEIFPGSRVETFTNPLLSAKYICNHPVDAGRIEEKMRPVNGIALLKVLRKQKPKLCTIMLAHSDLYSDAAMYATATDYMVRPVAKARLACMVTRAQQQRN